MQSVFAQFVVQEALFDKQKEENKIKLEKLRQI